jgi:hypothetical protein
LERANLSWPMDGPQLPHSSCLWAFETSNEYWSTIIFSSQFENNFSGSKSSSVSSEWFGHNWFAKGEYSIRTK